MKLITIILLLGLFLAGCDKENNIPSRTYGFELTYNIGSSWVKWGYTARFDSLQNLCIIEKREHPYILNSQRNFRISDAELKNLVKLTKELSDLNMVPEYVYGDTVIFDYPVDKLEYRFLNNEDTVYIYNLKNTPFQFDTLISYTHYLLDKYDKRE